MGSATPPSRPHPEWPLKRVGDLCYGNAAVAPRGWLAWAGTAEELDALVTLPALAIAEWKHVLEEHREGRVSLF